jgi:hypothetical protein
MPKTDSVHPAYRVMIVKDQLSQVTKTYRFMKDFSKDSGVSQQNISNWRSKAVTRQGDNLFYANTRYEIQWVWEHKSEWIDEVVDHDND